MAQAKRDANFVTSTLLVGSDGATFNWQGDETTGRAYVDIAGGAGTVTSVSVVSANGFAGTVATATTTPAITISTTINSPVLAGNGTAISAATTTGSGSTVVLATAPVFPTTITVGAAGGATGDILLKGTTSGTVTLTTADVAGTWQLTLPANDGDSGQFLRTDGSGVTTWATVTATPGGSDTQVQYNNAGALGGISGATTNGTFVTLTTPVLGVASATSINKVAITAPASSATLTIADGKTLTVSNTLTFTGTDTASVAFGGGGTVLYTASTIPLTVGTTTIASGTTTRILYDNAGVLGEYTLTGSGTVVAMQTAPTFITSITTPALFASANDSGAIGASGTAFSDVFLASGAVINFLAGDVTITHSSGILTVAGSGAGDFRVTTAGTNAASVVTVGGTQTLTNKTLTSPTITTSTLSGAQQLAEGAGLRLDQTLSADGTYSGLTIAGTAGATLAFGDLIYLAAADSRWELADADSATTADVMLGMCVLAAAADGDPTVILLQGNIRADAAFPSMTISARMYMGETAGDIQGTIPTGADNVIRAVGYALTADALYFNPSMDSQITAA